MKYKVGDAFLCRVLNSRLNRLLKKEQDGANFVLKIVSVDSNRMKGTYKYFNDNGTTEHLFTFTEIEVDEWIKEYQIVYSPLAEALK